jgi:hypothetical protein
MLRIIHVIDWAVNVAIVCLKANQMQKCAIRRGGQAARDDESSTAAWLIISLTTINMRLNLLLNIG